MPRRRTHIKGYALSELILTCSSKEDFMETLRKKGLKETTIRTYWGIHREIIKKRLATSSPLSSPSLKTGVSRGAD